MLIKLDCGSKHNYINYNNISYIENVAKNFCRVYFVGNSKDYITVYMSATELAEKINIHKSYNRC
jgi:hypothetical protein